MDNTFKNTSASLAIALCSPFLEADTDKDGFQRTNVIWCCDADGKSFSNPPSWALPDFDPTPNKQTPAPGNTANQQPPTHTKAPSTATYTHPRAHATRDELICRLLLEKKKKHTI
ncbi:hypothetical protein, partial [Helicobacter ailurogastricus]|uniref:hypothetical protein n=1 Tax=Helicobacter ailurogastricus TaxID=1578720 RepID=UPI0013156E99